MDENKQSIDSESTQIQAPAQTTAQTPAPTTVPTQTTPKKELGLLDLFYDVDIFTMIIIVLTVLGTIVATVGAIVTSFK